MILSAGKGTRVKPLTDKISKPMIPILRKPIIQHIIEHLKKSNINDIAINTSYLPDSISSYIRDGDQFGVNVYYSYEGYIDKGELVSLPMGSAGGMKKIQDFNTYFDSCFIVLCGDAIIDLDITKAYEFHKSKGALATVVLKEIDEHEVSIHGIVDMANNKKITKFQEKPSLQDTKSNLASTGIYIFEPEIFKHIPSNKFYDIGHDLLPQLVSISAGIYGYEDNFQWLKIRSVPDVFNASKKALEQKITNLNIPGKQIRPGVWIGSNVKINLDRVYLTAPIYIGSGSHIEDGVTIHSSVIGSNCHLENEVFLHNSFLSDNTRVCHLAKIENKLVSSKTYTDFSGRNINIDEANLTWIIRDNREYEYKDHGDAAAKISA